MYLRSAAGSTLKHGSSSVTLYAPPRLDSFNRVPLTVIEMSVESVPFGSPSRLTAPVGGMLLVGVPGVGVFGVVVPVPAALGSPGVIATAAPLAGMLPPGFACARLSIDDAVGAG